MNLPESTNYVVEVGKSSEKDYRDRDVYCIINRHTRVVEAETSLLFQAYDLVEQFEKELEEINAKVKEKPKFGVVKNLNS